MKTQKAKSLADKEFEKVLKLESRLAALEAQKSKLISKIYDQKNKACHATNLANDLEKQYSLGYQAASQGKERIPVLDSGYMDAVMSSSQSFGYAGVLALAWLDGYEAKTDENAKEFLSLK